MALLTISDLQLQLQRTVRQADQAAAQACIDAVSAAVIVELGSDPATWYDADAADLALIKAVACRAAATWFTNPEDRASFSGPEGMAWTPAPNLLARIISPDDLDKLMRVKLKRDPGFA